MDIKEEIHALSEEMLTNLGRLVAIDSQLGTPAEGKPFGEGPAKALEEGLKIADELGFKTVNLDNYCGYAEMGEGDEIVGIAGVDGNGQTPKSPAFNEAFNAAGSPWQLLVQNAVWGSGDLKADNKAVTDVLSAQ